MKLKSKSKKSKPVTPAAPSSDRLALLNILDQFNLPSTAFDHLRCDSYEKNLASQSLPKLEHFYTQLFTPKIPLHEIQKDCLPWLGKGPNNGKRPTLKTLCEIRQRLELATAIQQRRNVKQLITERRQDGARDEGTAYFNTAMEILGEELLTAKLAGKPISENLQAVDRLLRSAALHLREQREARADARFKWERGGKKIEVKHNPENRLVRLTAGERTVLEDIRTIAMIDRACGAHVNPYRKTDLPEMVAKVKAIDSPEEAQEPTPEPEAIEPASPQPTPYTPPPRIFPSKPVDTTPVDTRPEWQRKPGSILISGPCEKYPEGVGKCVLSGDPFCIATGRYLDDTELDSK